MTLLAKIPDPPDELWQRLKNQTKVALQTADPADYAYFKFIYLDSIATVSPVLTEYHLTVDWEEPSFEVYRKLRQSLGDPPPQVPINISFAGRSLGANQTLADIGAAYGDKIYFNVGSPGGPSSTGFETWSNYFKMVSTTIRRDFSLYEEIVETACSQLENFTNINHWSEQGWKLLLFMRNLPSVYADVAPGRSVLKSTLRLIRLLEVALEQQNAGAVYHATNILEWLAYLKPRMFEGVDLYEGDQARKALARGLLQAADPTRNMCGRVRMEAAWAIGWASVASQTFGHEVYEKLIEYEKIEELAPIVMTLRCAALRSFLYPTPYFIAATSQAGGWFQASILDQHQFRKIAVSDKHDEALTHFRSELADVLPRIKDEQ